MRLNKSNSQTFSGKRKKLSRTNLVLHTTKEYASSSTIHGFAYVFDYRHSVSARCLWTVVVILAFSLTIYQMTSLYTQWKNDPVITTLDTVALPIEDIEFPAVTICPQGSVQGILDNVLFKQLKEYIIRKRGLNRNERRRKKRSVSPGEAWNMTFDEMMLEASTFLSDVYPGAKDSPTKLVTLMEADDPEIVVQNEAVLLPTVEKSCDPASNIEAFESLNKQLYNDFCPDGFVLFDGLGCIHTSEHELTYEEASDYCNGQSGAEVLLLASDEEFRVLNEYNVIGIIASL